MSPSSSVSVGRRSCELALGLLVLYGLTNLISAQYGDDETFWADRDDFDEILDKYKSVNEDNCAFMHVGDLKVGLKFDDEALAQICDPALTTAL